MSVSLRLELPSEPIEPGRSLVGELTVHNTGETVDGFLPEALGDASAWTVFDPAIVRLLPDTEATIAVTITPPRLPSSTAGLTTFAVKTTPQGDPAGSAVEEVEIEILPFSDFSLEMVPQSATARRRARYELGVNNRSNVRLNAQLAGADTDEQLSVEFDPPTVVASPGEVAFVKTEVRPRRRIWRGPGKTHQFKVAAYPGEEAEPTVVDAALLQMVMIPRWFWKALLALLALILLLFLLWFFLLKPTVESTAKDAAEEQVEELIEEGVIAPGGGAPPPADEPGAEEPAAEEPAADEPAAEEPTPTPTPTPEVPAPAVIDPADQFLDHLVLEAVPGGTDQELTEPVGADQFLFVTDLVFGNPQGDIGPLALRRTGAVTDTVVDLSMRNFRVLDFHFVSPIILSEGDQLLFEMICDDVQVTVPVTTTCRPTVTIVGFFQDADVFADPGP